MTPPAPLIGQTISHYQIIDKIGAGGMGVVYRAHDEQLDRDVALKVLPVGTLADERARKQFRREALALAKLNHPNIETVYEFSSQNDIDFLAMELIPGRTLSEKLRDGPLHQQDILRFAMQLSDGLTAAHEQGIIHRDLKPSNLIIIPNGRLKILDFGLATLVQPETPVDLTLSGSVYSGRVSGTLPYMSPEQLRGMPVDPRSDIFAAGAVLYEMATGQRPFPQSQSVELMDAILHKTPDLPSTLNPEISPALERVICKSLEKEPSNRYHTAREMYAALEGVSASRMLDVPAMRPPSTEKKNNAGVLAFRGHFFKIARVVGLLIILGVLIYISLNGKKIRGHLAGLGTRKVEKTTNLLPVQSRRSVAVLGFKNVSGQTDKAWVSTALSEMLTTELAAGEQLRTISGEDVAHMKASLSLPETDGYSKETLQNIHKNLDTDVVVLGSYVVLGGGQIRLDVRLQDAVQGVSLAAISERGSENQIDELVTRAGEHLREKLGAGAMSSEQAIEVKAALPSTPEATRLYAEGIAKLRAFDNVAARDALQKAVLADPNLALAHSALASAYSALGYDEKARQSARNAFELSSRLPREDRLLVEARYREADKDWDHAVESYRVLFGFFPDNVEYGLSLAGAQIKGGKAEDALLTIESLGRLPSPAREDPRVDLKLAQAYVSLGDFGKAYAAASSANEKARQRSAKLILADALLQSSEASENLNQLTQAMAQVEEAEQIYKAAGVRNGEAKSQEIMANVLADKSDFSGAVDAYKKELDIAREIGNRRLQASALNNMALVLKGEGRLEEAKRMWEESLLGFREISDKANAAEVLINLGGLSLEEGDLARAKKTYGLALSLSQEVNDQSGISSATAALGTVLDAQGDLAGAKELLDRAIAMDLSSGMKRAPADKLISLADVLRHQGDLPLATKIYKDALTQAQEGDDKSNAAYALMGLGEISLDSANLTEARSNFDQALTTRTALGEERNVAATQAALAEVAIEEGHAVDASSLLKTTIEKFRRLGSMDEELAATIVLTQALLAQSKIADASRELTTAASGKLKVQNPALKIRFTIAIARTETAEGHFSSAMPRLKTALATATKLGMVRNQLECRLAMEEVTARTAKSAESRARLDQLERDATEKGFNLIARKAAQVTSFY